MYNINLIKKNETKILKMSFEKILMALISGVIPQKINHILSHPWKRISRPWLPWYNFIDYSISWAFKFYLWQLFLHLLFMNSNFIYKSDNNNSMKLNKFLIIQYTIYYFIDIIDCVMKFICFNFIYLDYICIKIIISRSYALRDSYSYIIVVFF